MKKMLLSLSLLMTLSLTTIAQQSPKEKQVKKESSAKTKADGTPDMRFKENKEKK